MRGEERECKRERIGGREREGRGEEEREGDSKTLR